MAIGLFDPQASSVPAAGTGSHADLTDRDAPGNHTKLTPATDSTAAVQVTKADGTTVVVNTDTTNGRQIVGDVPAIIPTLTGSIKWLAYRDGASCVVGAVAKSTAGVGGSYWVGFRAYTTTTGTGGVENDYFGSIAWTVLDRNKATLKSRPYVNCFWNGVAVYPFSIETNEWGNPDGTAVLRALGDGDVVLQTKGDTATPQTGLRVTKDGKVGIGTAAPAGVTHIVSTGNTAAQILEQASDDNSSCGLTQRKSRGTNAAPTNLQNGDYVSGQISQFRANGAWNIGSMLITKYVGNGTTNDCEVTQYVGVTEALKYSSKGSVEARQVVPNAVNLAHNVVSSEIDLSAAATTTVFTPNSGEEWVAVTSMLVPSAWAGTSTTAAKVKVLAGTADALSELTLATTYAPATDGGVMMAGAAAPTARKRFTNANPLKLQVTTAQVGATEAKGRLVIQLVRVK
jgi:hypothetical protein